MDDVDRAQIGQKREVAHEIIKHPAIPKTNLPPMKVKGWKNKYDGLLSSYRGSPKHRSSPGIKWGYVILLLVLVIFITRLIGMW